MENGKRNSFSGSKKVQYDILAESYVKTDETILKKYVTTETVFQELGPIAGKDILDLGCGNGYFCRLYKARGAKKVVGLDLSENQIELAQRAEVKRSLGINYSRVDITENVRFKSEFDFITSIFVLNYIENKNGIAKIAENVSKSLRPGGKFIATIVNPEIKLPYPKKYGRTISGNQGTLRDSDRFKVNFYDDGGKHLFDADCINWSKETYQKSFSDFDLDIRWRQPVISNEGLEELGGLFWSEFIENPYFILLECKKKV